MNPAGAKRRPLWASLKDGKTTGLKDKILTSHLITAINS
jgi:hypothetical protein